MDKPHEVDRVTCWCEPYTAGDPITGWYIYHRDQIARAIDRTPQGIGPYVVIWQRERTMA
jgi:hypothetical protein